MIRLGLFLPRWKKRPVLSNSIWNRKYIRSLI